MALLDQAKIEKGKAFPLGMSVMNTNHIHVSVWKKQARNCKLRLYRAGKLLQQIVMPSLKEEGMDDVFAVDIQAENLTDELTGLEYDFWADGESFLDPYVKAVSGRNSFGKKQGKLHGKMCFEKFDWSGENRVSIPTQDVILYQCHVRGFTKHSSSGVANPGTFSGLQEKIPYLKELGINTLLLLPIYDFDEVMKDVHGNSMNKINYWGYGSEAYYYAPKASYGSGKDCVIHEFKSMVKELHRNGMNLFLDMYFVGKSPEFVMDCLRYYAMTYHIDGFRINQECIDVAWIHEDPVLSHCRWIGNNWGEQSADFGKEQFWEMNDGFLVDARRFLKSDEGQTEKFYHRFREQRQGVGIVHYITQNNGFTLRDLISMMSNIMRKTARRIWMEPNTITVGIVAQKVIAERKLF